VDGRERPLVELHVDRGSRDLNDFADVLCHINPLLQLCRVKTYKIFSLRGTEVIARSMVSCLPSGDRVQRSFTSMVNNIYFALCCRRSSLPNPRTCVLFQRRPSATFVETSPSV